MRYNKLRNKPYKVEIEVEDPRNLERFIKKFVKKVKKSGILQEVRDRRYFEKPSTKRHRKDIERKRSIENDNRKRKAREEKLRRGGR